jgi:hypothetical protein
MTTDPVPLGDPLGRLDFAVICSLTHYGRDCTREAVAIANVHACGTMAGESRRPVCAFALRVADALAYPVICPTCGNYLHTKDEYLWNVEPI